MQIYEQPKDNGRFLKNISFAFTVYYNDKEFTTIAFGEDALKEYADNLTKENLVGWDKEITDETVVLLSQQKPDDYIEIEVNLDEIDATSAEIKATYLSVTMTEGQISFFLSK